MMFEKLTEKSCREDLANFWKWPGIYLRYRGYHKINRWWWTIRDAAKCRTWPLLSVSFSSSN